MFRDADEARFDDHIYSPDTTTIVGKNWTTKNPALLEAVKRFGGKNMSETKVTENPDGGYIYEDVEFASIWYRGLVQFNSKDKVKIIEINFDGNSSHFSNGLSTLSISQDEADSSLPEEEIEEILAKFIIEKAEKAEKEAEERDERNKQAKAFKEKVQSALLAERISANEVLQEDGILWVRVEQQWFKSDDVSGIIQNIRDKEKYVSIATGKFKGIIKKSLKEELFAKAKANKW